MASNGTERKIGFLHIAVFVVPFWGLGVTVGRFFPAAHTPESLAQRLTHLCSTYEVSCDSSLLDMSEGSLTF